MFKAQVWIAGAVIFSLLGCSVIDAPQDPKKKRTVKPVEPSPEPTPVPEDPTPELKVLEVSYLESAAIEAQVTSYNPSSMRVARSAHAAVRLGAEKFMVIGGNTVPAGMGNTAEIYDPELGFWRMTAPMRKARLSPRSIVLKDGRVLVFDGISDQFEPEVYDPKTDVWTVVHTPANIPPGSTVIGIEQDDAKVLISGSQIPNYLYDPISNSIALLPNAPNFYAESFIRISANEILVKSTCGSPDPYIEWGYVYNSLLRTAQALSYPVPSECTTGSILASLGGGKILSAGGWVYPWTGINRYKSYIFDSIGLSWEEKAVLSNNVYGERVVTFAGGKIGVYTSTPELIIYNPGTDLWSVAAAYPEVVSSPPIVLDGNILRIFGGSFAGGGGISKKVASYDFDQNKWSIARLNVARSSPRAVKLSDGKVLLQSVTSAEIYDPVSDRWTATAAASFSASMVALPNAQALSFFLAGNGAQKFNPSDLSWSAVAALPAARSGLAAVSMLDSKVMVVGGGATAALRKSTVVYDPDLNTWQSGGADMAYERTASLVTRLNDGRIMVAGGTPNPLKVEIFDPSENEWTEVADLPYARVNGSIVTLGDGRVMLAGGAAASRPYVDVYDPVENQWSTTSINQTSASASMSLQAYGERSAIVCGGANLVAMTIVPWDSCEVFDADNNTWSVRTGVGKRYSAALVVLNDNRVLFAGGASTAGTTYEVLTFYRPVPLRVSQGTAPYVFEGVRGSPLAKAHSTRADTFFVFPTSAEDLEFKFSDAAGLQSVLQTLRASP